MGRKTLSVVATVAILLGGLFTVSQVNQTQAAPDPITCTGYPEPRIFLETQDWWTPIPVLGGTGHVHLGMCFPLGQTVSGTVTFNVRVLLHDNKGKLIRVKGQDDKSNNFFLTKPNITPPDGGQHEYWFTVNADTTKMPDGLRLFRWYADLLHANNNTQTARAGWPLDVENGKTDSNGAKADQIKYQNWYKVASPPRDWGYTGPILSTVKPGASTSISIKCTTSTGIAIDRTMVHINPNFHDGDQGRVVLNQAGAFNGTLNISNLVAGDKVVVRCQQVDGSETHEGVGVMPVK